MTKRTTPSFSNTRAVFDAALSRMPITRTVVHKNRMTTAGRLNQAPVLENGSLHRNEGTSRPNQTSRNLLKYFDHDAATVAALIAYSRIKSQPMIQANSSPSVA